MTVKIHNGASYTLAEEEERYVFVYVIGARYSIFKIDVGNLC